MTTATKPDAAALAAAGPEAVQLLRDVLDAFWLDPSDIAQTRTLEAVETFLWVLDGNE